MRPVLVGTDNPHSSDPSRALVPYPARCSGWRLWKMLNDRTSASKRQYMAAFDRRNIDTHGLSFEEGSQVILLGETVRKALKIPKLLIHPQVVGGVAYRQIPHPSGKNLFYNDPVQREIVAILLEDLYKEWRMLHGKEA